MRRTAKDDGDSAGRVLILVENLSVPFDRRVWKEATALTDKGYKVTVVCPRGRQCDQEKHEVIDNVSIYRLKIYEAGSGLLSYILEYSQAIIKMMLMSLLVFFKEGFDVIHICSPPDLLCLVAMPYKLLGKKVIFDHHDLSPELYLSKKKKVKEDIDIVHKTLVFFERLTFKIADIVLATNESYKKVAMSRGNVPESQVFVVRNGPDPKRIKPVKENPALKHGKSHLILYVGVMGLQDGVDYLLRSIQFLVHERKRDDLHAMIVGSGTELDKLKLCAQELAIDGVVTFTGRIPDSELVEALSTADVCVCPDPKTPLNDVSTMNKTLEYMGAGKPVVAFDLCETRVSAGDAALYARPNDEEDFGDKIATLLDSDKLRERLGKIGQDRIHSGLAWKYSTAHLLEAYAAAMRRTRRKPSLRPLGGRKQYSEAMDAGRG